MFNKTSFLLFFIIFILCTPSLIGQVRKNDIILASLWNFRISNKSDKSDNPRSTLSGAEYLNSTKVFNYKFSQEIGFSLTNNFVVGVSLDYAKDKEEIENFSTTPANPFNGVREEWFMKITEKTTVRPGVFIKRFTRLSDRFQVVSKFGLFLRKDRFNGLSLFEINGIRSSNADPNKEVKYLHANITNSILFYLNPYIGIQLRVLDFGTETRYYDSSYGRNFQSKDTKFYTDVNPLNWRYGFVFIFGNKRSTLLPTDSK